MLGARTTANILLQVLFVWKNDMDFSAAFALLFASSSAQVQWATPINRKVNANVPFQNWLMNFFILGVFINAQDAVKKTKSPGVAMLLWFFMGVHSTIGALCYAELGTTLPVSGGDYAYINEAFGSFMAFQYQWCSTFLFMY
jgi:amino acid transporter